MDFDKRYFRMAQIASEKGLSPAQSITFADVLRCLQGQDPLFVGYVAGLLASMLACESLLRRGWEEEAAIEEAARIMDEMTDWLWRRLEASSDNPNSEEE